MPQFKYVAFDQEQQRTTGVVEAENAEAALDALASRYMAITELRPVRRRWFGQSQSNRQEELLQMTQEMSALLGSGISLKTALDIVVSDSRTTSLYGTFVEVNAAVTGGTPLSVALRRYPRVFSRFYVNMVEAGEASGNLPEMLDRLSFCIAKSGGLTRKLKATLTYPCIVFGFSLLVVTLLMTVGIPRIERVYRDLGSQLPAVTRALLAVSSWLSHNWVVGLLVAAAAGYKLRQWAQSDTGAVRLDRWKLNSPLSHFYRELLLTRFTRTLSTLYGSGVPVLQALELAGGALGNREAERLLQIAAREVAQGASLGHLLRRLPFFTEMALGLVHAGEATGSLSVMLGRIADYYESRYEMSIEMINKVLEPVLMIGVGLMVGALVLVLGLPFMNLTAVV